MTKTPMSQEERVALQNAKMSWRKEMRAYFPNWTKKGANRRDASGRLMMNVPTE